MINISVKTLEKSKKGAHVECRGAITGNGGDIRREMIAALQMFDEVADGNILCDAFEEFLAIKIQGGLTNEDIKSKEDNQEDNQEGRSNQGAR